MDKSKIPIRYQTLFADIEQFNEVQAKVFNDCVFSDASLVVSAPTGSGKTTIFLLAIMQELIKVNWPETEKEIRLIYVAPTRALCSEIFEKWEEKFSQLAMRCCEVTGETSVTDLAELEKYHIILTTPEKWDSLTRRWRENINFLMSVRLVMIDEIHLLNEARRGAALEATISRIKIGALKSGHTVRLIGISATLANVQDVAKWFGEANTKAYTISINSHGSGVVERIVTIALGEEESFFKVDAIMNWRLPGILERYWDGKPTLVFCGTRMCAENTVKYLLKNFDVGLRADQEKLLESVTNEIFNRDLRECVRMGIGFHHGGLTIGDRLIVEHMYRTGNLPVLVCTQTLAMGVNFPAHLVIVKAPSPISATEMLQMTGRAGRVGLTSDCGVAVILTRTCHAVMYQNLRGKISPIESTLQDNLENYMNSEVFAGNVFDDATALKWIKSSFFYVRLLKNPTHYGYHEDTVENQLTDVCKRTIESLKNRGLIEEKIQDKTTFTSTIYGSLVARYFLDLDTLKCFQEEITGGEKLMQLFNIVCKCSEFQQFTLRVSDKKILNEWNTSHDSVDDDECPTGQSKLTLRFPISGKINSIPAKVSCILQAMLGNLNVSDTHFRDEADKMISLASHLTKCLLEVLKIFPGEKYSAVLNTLILLKCFTAELWEDSPFICRQLLDIDENTAQLLADNGFCTFEALHKTNFGAIDQILPGCPDIARKIMENVSKIPQYSLKFCWINSRTLSVKVCQNNEYCENEAIAAALVVGDTKSNSLLFFSENVFENGNNIEVTVDIDIQFSSIHIHLIHLSLVGVDVHLVLDQRERYTMNNAKMQNMTALLAIPAEVQEIDLEPTCSKKPRLDSDWKNEVQVMELYEKSLKREEIENTGEPFDLGIDYFFRQLESNTMQKAVNKNTDFFASSADSAPMIKGKVSKDCKIVFEQEMTRILKKQYYMNSRNLQSDFRRGIEDILTENDTKF